MIRTVKPKNARSKRALEKREPKLVENTKSAIFVRGQSSSQALHDITVDLAALKKPYSKRLEKRNKILPFEDATGIEFLSEKNDASLIVLSTSNKKRPNTLTWIRTFDYHIYDMVELQVLSNYKLFDDFKKQAFQVGLKPMFVFQGQIFDIHPVYKQIKSVILDMYRGDVVKYQDVAGLQSIIAVSALEEDDNNSSVSKLPLVFFRTYKLISVKSTEPRLPRIELEETGPRIDFKVGRYQAADAEVEKLALKKPKQLDHKMRKNVEIDKMGDTVARVHVGKQDLSKLQTRKVKGLKSRYDQVDSDAEEVDVVDEIIDDSEPKRQKL